jgi:phosphomannomutase
MSTSALRVGVGMRVVYDGELLEVAELHARPSGTETVLRSFVRSDEEKLTTELLDKIKIDAASEKARQELELAINTGKMKVRRKAG